MAARLPPMQALRAFEAAARTGTEMEFAPDVPSAVRRACALTGNDDGIVVVTGSIYVVGDAMQALGVPA